MVIACGEELAPSSLEKKKSNYVNIYFYHLYVNPSIINYNHIIYKLQIWSGSKKFLAVFGFLKSIIIFKDSKKNIENDNGCHAIHRNFQKITWSDIWQYFNQEKKKANYLRKSYGTIWAYVTCKAGTMTYEYLLH